VPVDSPVEGRRADILIASPRGESVRYALEIQDSAVGETELWRRTRSYSAVSIRTIWISLLRHEHWKPARRTDGSLWVEKYAPRLHERWIEKLAGEVWFYDPDSLSFWCARFEDHMLHREGLNFINPGLGEHIEIEPYDVSSQRWVDARVTGPWKLSQIRISAHAKRPIGTLTGPDGEKSGRT
jgi:hypothetical protein